MPEDSKLNGNARLECFDLLGEVTSSNVDALDAVGQGVTFINGDAMRHAVTRIEDTPSRSTGSVEAQHSLQASDTNRAKKSQPSNTSFACSSSLLPVHLSSSGRGADLDVDEHARNRKGLEHDLCHLFAIVLRVHGCLNDARGKERQPHPPTHAGRACSGGVFGRKHKNKNKKRKRKK